MLTRIKSTYHEFPLEYWILVLANFIDSIGGTMIWPFFALYVTQKFDVGMTEAGILIAIFSVSGFIGSMIGGALADKFGRRSLAMGFLMPALLLVLSPVLAEQRRRLLDQDKRLLSTLRRNYEREDKDVENWDDLPAPEKVAVTEQELAAARKELDAARAELRRVRSAPSCSRKACRIRSSIASPDGKASKR